jgi:two-component system response regulator YesN
MYTVLLADDEKSILDALCDTIAWQQFGVDQVLRASDGRQALSIIRQQKVDLLITDILMPQMDGLTLIRILRREFPRLHCILLSGHGEFQYAKEAIRLNVENYLLKPLNRTELEETVEMALNNLYDGAERQRSWEDETLFGDNLLIRWLNNAISPEELGERASFLDLNLFLPQFCAVCIQKKHDDIAIRPFCQVLTHKLKTRYEVSFLWDKKGRHVFILGGHQLDAEFILSCFRELLPAYPVISQTAVCVGEIVSSASKLSVSYQSACRTLDALNLRTDDFVTHVCPQGGTVRQDALYSRLERLFHIADSGERSLRTQEFLALLLSSASAEDAYDLLSRALMQLFIQSFPEKREPRSRLENRLRMDNAHSSADWGELIDFTYLLYQHTLNELSPVVQRAVNYIQENYAQQISIKEYCVLCKMSTPYFGHLFKTETGMFFNNYLNQCRMCAAIALLHDTELKISDIAEKCGFSSDSYFISCFKKQIGLSPIKFRALRGS